MKKLAIAALALALPAAVNANPVASESAEGAGAVNVAGIAASGVVAAVVGGVVSNNRKSVVVDNTIKPEEPVCDDGSKPDSGGVCKTTTVTVTVTGTGTGTATGTSTTTITVPVTYTVF